MPVALYMRVSTDEQRERQSIATQREELQRYCATQSLELAEIYGDDGISGTVPFADREAGGRALRDARSKKYDTLLVYKIDRIGRDEIVIHETVREFERLGVTVISITQLCDVGTANGRFMLGIHSAVAAFERAQIRERSMAGTNRVARLGAWLGGVVPFGYRKVGQKANAALVLADDPIPGVGISEAEVIRTIFRMAGTEHKNCYEIAKCLNRMGVPPSYIRDERLVTRGKRKQRTAGIWSPGRVRNMLISTTYKGIHAYGKRSKNLNRESIERSTRPIVTEELWRQAQETLRSNVLFSPRNAKREYLLRSLIRCGICGRTFIALAAPRGNGKEEFYYRCAAKNCSRAFYSPGGKRCAAKDVNGAYLEGVVWAEVENLIRNPGSVIELLKRRAEEERGDGDHRRERLESLQATLADKQPERDRVVWLFRKGRISESELDRQIEEIDREEGALRVQVDDLSSQLRGITFTADQLASTEGLLQRLSARLDAGLSFPTKRAVVETLVAGIKVDTIEAYGVKQAEITIHYRFSEPEQAEPLAVFTTLQPPAAVRIPTDPKTIGDHMRRKRLEMKMFQKDVARRIGVDETSVFNWESNASTPEIRFMPTIIAFLGFNPLPAATTLAEGLIRQRTTLGLSQKGAARALGVDPSTLARWEQGKRTPPRKLAGIVAAFLEGTPSTGVACRVG